MTKQEYIETLYINGIKVDVGIDDYGQCYFFEYTDENGQFNSIGCGTYNEWYLEEIYYYLDPYSTEISLYGKDEFDAITANMLARYQKYIKEDPNDKFANEWYESTIKPRLELKTWNTYDFEQMYKDRGLIE